MAPLSHTAIANDHTRLFCILVFWNITILKDRILDLFYALNIKKTETCTNLKLSNFIRKARENKFFFILPEFSPRWCWFLRRVPPSERYRGNAFSRKLSPVLVAVVSWMWCGFDVVFSWLWQSSHYLYALVPLKAVADQPMQTDSFCTPGKELLRQFGRSVKRSSFWHAQWEL